MAGFLTMSIRAGMYWSIMKLLRVFSCATASWFYRLLTAS